MAAVLFAKLGQNYYQTSFPSHIYLMKAAAQFQILQHLDDFQTIGYGGHFVFQNKAKILYRHVFIAVNIPCKFGKDIFIHE